MRFWNGFLRFLKDGDWVVNFFDENFSELAFLAGFFLGRSLAFGGFESVDFVEVFGEKVREFFVEDFG